MLPIKASLVLCWTALIVLPYAGDGHPGKKKKKATIVLFNKKQNKTKTLLSAKYRVISMVQL